MSQNINANQISLLTSTILGRSAAGTGPATALDAATAKTILALQNVDNTSDANKPVSSATTTALGLKANLSGGNTFSGNQQFGSIGVGAAADANYALLVRNTGSGYGLQINTTSPTISVPQALISNGTNQSVWYVDSTAANFGAYSNVDLVLFRNQAEGLRLTTKGVSVTGNLSASNMVTVAYASTANFACGASATVLTASAVGVTLIDGQALSVGDRVLLKDQSAPAQNGVYQVTTVGTASVATVFTRVAELNTWTNIITSVEVTVSGGSTNLNSIWLCTTTASGGTLGTTAINFRALNTGAAIPNSTGLKITSASSTLDFYAADGTTWNGGASGGSQALTLTGGTGGLTLDTTTSGALTLMYAGTIVAQATNAGFSVSKLLSTAASTTSSAGITLPHGAAPSSPTNGDIWTTTTGFFARINNTTASVSGVNTGDQTSVSGSAGSVVNAVTWNNSGTGAASGATFNGSAAVTISYNTIGAQPASTQLTAVAGAAWSAGTQVLTLTAANTVTLKTVGSATGNILDKASGDSLYLALGGGSLTGKLTTVASAVGGAGLTLPHGAAPSSPGNGDIWTTTTALQGQFNGTTKTLPFSDGTNASGTWGISISGNAATATSASSATSAGSVTNTLTLSSAGTGDVSGTTYNGSVARTLSYNSIGAAPLASPGLTGTPTAPTATADTNTTQLATTAFVQASEAVIVVAGLTGGVVNLTAAQAGAGVLIFTGTLTSNVTVNFSSGSAAAFNRGYTVVNNTGGAFTFTLQACATSPSNSVVINGSTAGSVITNGASIVLADWAANQATFNSATKGVVPASGGGTTNFLRADGSFAVPVGSTTNAITFNNAGSGAASGSTFNGSAAQTISYNTIGAPSSTGTNASGTWGISITGNASTATTASTANSTTASLTFNNGGAGATSGTTFNGGTAQTISYNTVGAPSTTGTNASGTWGINITGAAASVTNALTISNSGTGAASGTTFNGSAAQTISYNSIGAAPTSSPTFTGTASFAAITTTGSVGVGGSLTAPTASSGTNGTTVATTAYVQSNFGLLSLPVTGGTVTLTQDQAANAIIVLTGTLTSNLTLNFGSGSAAYFNRRVTIFNNTSGAFTVSISPCVTSPGNVSVVTQGFVNTLWFNGNAVSGIISVSSFSTFSSGSKGVVPASGGGTTNFLRADSTFANPLDNAQANGSGFKWTDASGTNPLLTCQGDNNFVFYSTGSTGAARPVWGIFARSDTSTFNINTDTILASGTSNAYVRGTSFLKLTHDSSNAYIYSQTGTLYLGGAVGSVGLQIANNGAVSSASTWSYTNNVTIDVGGGANSSSIALKVANGTYYMQHVARMAAGNYNPLVQAGDSGIIFSQSSAGTGNIVIAPWTSNGDGVRIDSDGTLGCSSTNGNQIILKAGIGSGPSVIFRNDNTNFYILKTAASTGIPSGSWDTTRPLTINLGSGNLSSANGQTFSGGFVNNNWAQFFTDNSTPAIDATTPNNGSTGGVRLRGNATSGSAFLQITNSTAATEWANVAWSSSGQAAFSGQVRSTSNGFYASADWYRLAGTGGLYWETYARGIQPADAGQSDYGNFAVYGPGLNGWTGVAIGTSKKTHWMTDNSTLFGMYDNTGGGWLIQCDFSGNFTAKGNVTAYSDLRLKQNVRPIPDVEVRRNNLAASAIMYERDGRTRIGYGAQLLRDNGNAEFVMEADDAFKLATGLGTLSVDYGETAAVLAVASKLTDDKVSALEERIAQLEALLTSKGII